MQKHSLAMQKALTPTNMGWGAGQDPNEMCYGNAATYREFGGFWLHSQAVAHVFRLNGDLEAAFDLRRRAELGWRGSAPPVPTIAMHVRRGDKCRVGARNRAVSNLPGGLCDPSLSAYREAAEAIQRQYGANRIFLATDDAMALSECRQWGGFLCSAFAGNGSFERGANSASNAEQGERAAGITAAMLLDLDTLSRCDYFIGAFASTQVSNIAYELLVARKGHHVPFITFGHWQWGDIDHRTDVFKNSPRGKSSRGREHASFARAVIGVPLVVLFIVLPVAACAWPGTWFEDETP